MKKKRLRNLNQIAYEDYLWPQRGLGTDHEENLRYQALYEVLSYLPEKDYQTLKEREETFELFIPPEGAYGMCYPFVANVRNPKILGLKNLSFKTVEGKRKRMIIAPHARVIYLGPELERIAWDRILAVVAHELAHIILGHPVYSREEYDKNEEEAWALIREWGYVNEAKKHIAFCKRADTLMKKQVERLRAVSG